MEFGLGDVAIYVIDDDEGSRRSLTFLLHAADEAVRSFSSAEDFLADAPGLPPGVVITDIRMPGRDGLQLLKEAASRSLPMTFIVATGHADARIAAEAQASGAKWLLEKPFDTDLLIERVREALQQQARPSMA